MGMINGASWGASTFKTLDGAQHRNRRRDRAIAVEKRRSDQAEHQNEGARAAWWRIAGVEQGEHGHDAALAAVVSAQDQDGVFQRNDEDQGPEHEREDAEDRRGGGRSTRTRGFGRFFQGIERTGPDVAVDDAERTERCGERQAVLRRMSCHRRV